MKYVIFALGLVATLLGMATNPAFTVVGVIISAGVMVFQFVEDHQRDSRLKEKKLEFAASAWTIERESELPVRACLRIEAEAHRCGALISVRTEQTGIKKLDLKEPQIDARGGITIYNSPNTFWGTGVPITVYVAGRG